MDNFEILHKICLCPVAFYCYVKCCRSFKSIMGPEQTMMRTCCVPSKFPYQVRSSHCVQQNKPWVVRTWSQFKVQSLEHKRRNFLGMGTYLVRNLRTLPGKEQWKLLCVRTTGQGRHLSPHLYFRTLTLPVILHRLAVSIGIIWKP